MKKRMKGMCTLLLAGALAATLLPGLPSARAAGAVDTDASCSLEIKVSTTDTYTGLMELKSEEVTVDLYKVAAIDATGAYTAVAPFGDMAKDLSEISSATTTDKWSELAKTAAGKVTADTAVTKTITLAAGQESGKATGLDTGLYLVKPEQLVTDYYTYDFDPYLVSLPNNYYYETGNDTWVYDLIDGNAMGLKTTQKERLGNLELTKNLSNWSDVSGGSEKFIFEISYTSPSGNSETWLEAMTFTGAGNQTLEIKNIPAGSKVTVEEKYSGSAYTVVSDSDGNANGIGTVETEIVANADVDVTITNAHDNTPNGGSGIINHYEPENDEYPNTDPENPDSTGGRTVVEETTEDEAQPLD